MKKMLKKEDGTLALIVQNGKAFQPIYDRSSQHLISIKSLGDGAEYPVAQDSSGVPPEVEQ